MKQIRLIGALVSLLSVCGWYGMVYADTCETRVATDTAEFPANKPAPIICNTNGHVRVESGQATTTAPGLTDGTITGFSFDLNGNARVVTSGGVTGGTANAAAPSLVEGTQYGFSLDLAGNLRTTLGTLLSGEIQGSGSDPGMIVTSGATVRQTIVASGVTTNTTSAALAGPAVGSKTFYGQVVGTGAVTQTQAIYGDIDNDAANGILLCTLTLSGTTRTQDACPVVTAAWSYFYVITTATTGTSATGAVYVMY